MKRRDIMITRRGALGGAATALAAGPAFSQAAPSVTPELVDAANKEGKVVWYTSVDVKVAESVADAFRKAHPKIEVEVERSGRKRTATLEPARRSSVAGAAMRRSCPTSTT